MADSALTQDVTIDVKGYPKGQYTPYGYLQNPYHIARHYGDVEGGNIRSSADMIGFGWVYPTERRAMIEVGLGLGLKVGDTWHTGRNDFPGAHATHVSAHLFAYGGQVGPDNQIEYDVRYFLVERDVLGCLVTLTNRGSEDFSGQVGLLLHAWAREGNPEVASTDLPAAQVTATVKDGPIHRVLVLLGPRFAGVQVPRPTSNAVPIDGNAAVDAIGADVSLKPGEKSTIVACLIRDEAGSPDALAQLAATDLLKKTLDAYRTKVADDESFYETCPIFEGDFPDHIKRGFVYDIETTRLCTMPPGGIFKDVWPTWMQAYPRAVLAEGAMDMMRLAYADPDLAKRAILSLFRDTPGDNVPCVHQGGEFNMVARDGSKCGTSPAWCIPFYSIYLVYLRTMDREWAKALYPHLVAYVEWWLEHRTDDGGWLVYKCTWEAGEDNTPRLDPDETGDHVVSGVVRPVELQAVMAQSAHLLAKIARTIGEEQDVDRWEKLEAEFIDKTRQLWDPEEGRFRDWDKRKDEFLAYEGVPDNYWGANPVRFSSLSLTPAMLGVASEEQMPDLRKEIELYHRIPMTVWPSWCYVTAEAATSAGMHEFVSKMAYEVVDKVYRENDRRDQSEYRRPYPGNAREYWPADPKEFRGSDVYAWGAHTATLLMRQIVGFRESEADGWELVLCPALPDDWMSAGKRYVVKQIPYRGRLFSLEYEVGTDAGSVTVKLTLDEPADLEVEKDGVVIAQSSGQVHEFVATRFAEHRVRVKGVNG